MNKSNLLTSLLSWPFYALSSLTKKRKDLWIFGAWMGEKYADNPQALFEYINSIDNDINTIWISKNRDVVQAMRAEGLASSYAYSIEGIQLQMRAELCIFSHSCAADFFAATIGKNTKCINLWHGVPIKKIGYDDVRQPRNKLKQWLSENFFPYREERNDLMFCDSQAAATIFQSAFGVGATQVIITGEPRRDYFHQAKEEQPLANKQLQFLYVPTFRNQPGSAFNFFGNYLDKVHELQEKLAALNAFLSIRLHPVNKPDEATQMIIRDNANMDFEESPELNKVLNKFDCMITDYSSLMMDFASLDRPIVFMPLDLYEYLKQDRDLYVDYLEFTDGARFDDWQMFAEKLEQIVIDTRCGALRCPAKVKAFVSQINDGRNCERVYQHLMKLE